MTGFFFKFFGLRLSGFRRQNKFIAWFLRFRYSQYMKNSIAYFGAILFSLSMLGSFVVGFSPLHLFYSETSRLVIPLKLLASVLISFPMTLSEYIVQNKKLKNEVQKLQQENDYLKISLNNIKNLETEVVEIKKAVDFKYSVSNYKVIEKVLGFDNSAYESFMLISITHNNIMPGCVVISSEGIVGIVYDINGDVARVMHIADQKLSIPVQTLSGDHLIISGNGKDYMLSKELREDLESSHTKISKGDLLITSGEGGIFQHGIPVARVVSVTNDTIQAAPVTKIDNISFVWIVRPVLPSKS